jgi:benzoyl-CoA reductase/2-hydroxyglutaryl-CoA dehydratase subunit BcrC/BadD/HgdB
VDPTAHGEPRGAGVIAARVDALLGQGLETLQRAKTGGTKVVGYLPGGFVPEELIYASGAIPLCLAAGGDARVADEALSLVPSVICSFARTQIGRMQLRSDPFYSSLDLLVVPSTCQHMKKIGDVCEYRDGPPVFKLGVPYEHDKDFELEYYRDRLHALKQRLEALTGNDITRDRLVTAVAAYNRLRGLLRTLAQTRRRVQRTDGPEQAIDALDFARLNHASFCLDPVTMAASLEEICAALPSSRLLKSDAASPERAGYAQDEDARSVNRPQLRCAICATEDQVSRRNALSGDRGFAFRQPPSADLPADAGAPADAGCPSASARPRLLLMGPNLAAGDYDLLTMVTDAGADVVVEDIFEGIRDYWQTVEIPADKDPIEALARAYLFDKRPAAFMRGTLRARLDVALGLIGDFAVSGVLWYQLLCCEFYDEEAYWFEMELRKRGIPMLVVESDYHTLDSGQLRTRLAAFIETLLGGPLDA